MSTLNYISYLFRLWCHLRYTCSDRLWYHLSCQTYNYCSDSGVTYHIILVQTLVSLMLYLFRSTLVSLIMSYLIIIVQTLVSLIISYLFRLWCHLCYTCSDRLWYHLSCHTYNYCSDSGVTYHIILVQTLVSLMLYLFRSTLVSLMMSYYCSDSGVTYHIILVQTLVSLIVLVQIDPAWYHLSYHTHTCSDSGVTYIILSLVQPLVSLISYLVLFNLWCHLSCIYYIPYSSYCGVSYTMSCNSCQTVGKQHEMHDRMLLSHGLTTILYIVCCRPTYPSYLMITSTPML